MRQRVQKIIAASGHCSRRKAEEFIEAGKVLVNGVKITLGDKADPDKDNITVGKTKIIVEEHLYLMMNKPSGYITTREDLFGRKNVMDLLTNIERPIYPVGRLDRDARGLLLLTSDGDFAQKILHPSRHTTKTYQATLDKPMTSEAAKKLSEGVRIEKRLARAKIRKIKPKLVEITIAEGRNKIIKKIFNEVGYYVSDLKRVGIGELRLNVAEGKWRELTQEEIDKLLNTQELFKKDVVKKPREMSFSKDKARKGKQIDSEKRRREKEEWQARNSREKKDMTRYAPDSERQIRIRSDTKRSKPYTIENQAVRDARQSEKDKEHSRNSHRPTKKKTSSKKNIHRKK